MGKIPKTDKTYLYTKLYTLSTVLWDKKTICYALKEEPLFCEVLIKMVFSGKNKRFLLTGIMSKIRKKILKLLLNHSKYGIMLIQ